MQTKAGRDPKATWRKKSVTRRQTFLAQEMARALNAPLPDFSNRGDAFDWIYKNGGNARFWQFPPTPAMPV